jgi:hypothetical protein
MDKRDLLLDKLKELITIKDLSESLGISRPTIYNYAKYYVEGNLKKVPEAFQELFGMLNDGDAGAKDYLDIMPDRFEISQNRKVSASGKTKTEHEHVQLNDVQTICLQDSDKFMVIFQTVPSVEETVLKLYIMIEKNYFFIGTYRPEEEKNFVIIRDLVFTANYYYEVEQTCVDGVHVSGLLSLSDDSKKSS